MSRKSTVSNVVMLAGGILILLVAVSWYNKRIMEGFTNAGAIKAAFEKFTDEQKNAVCVTMNDQITANQADLDAVEKVPENANRIEELTKTIVEVEALKKSYGC